jgi:hypothetical protein
MRPLRGLRRFPRTPPTLLAAILTVVASVVALHVVRVSTAHAALSLYGPVMATTGAVTAACLASSVEPRGLIVPPSRAVTWRSAPSCFCS